jgi:hypothetical protein
MGLDAPNDSDACFPKITLFVVIDHNSAASFSLYVWKQKAWKKGGIAFRYSALCAEKRVTSREV